MAGSSCDPLWGPIWVSLCFISSPRKSFFDFNFGPVIVLFWLLKFFIPRGGIQRSDPLWGPIWVSLCFIFLLEKKFFDFIFCTRNRPFLTPENLYCDGRMVVDGGWWMVDGWVPKRFSDFAQNFVRWSSQHINLLYFGKSAKNFFYRKKIRLQVSKSGVFSEKKSSANFLTLS